MYAPFLLGGLLACVGTDGKDGSGDTDEPEPLVITDEWPGFAAAGDAVYIRFDDVPKMVRARPDGVEALDLEGRTPLWADATPDGRFLLVLTESDAGMENVLVEDGAIFMAFADQETNRIEISPDGRHLALWHDDTLDSHTNALVDVTQVTLVDTEARTATRVATALAPKTVALGTSNGLVVGPTGAVGLDLAAQVVTQAYTFADEGVANGSWGYWGALSPDEAYAFVSGDEDELDDTVVRLGLTERSVRTVQAPSVENDGWRDERAPHLFRVGDVLFVNNPDLALSWMDPDTMAFTTVQADVDYFQMTVQADRAVLNGDTSAVDDGTYLLWTEPSVDLHLDRAESGTNSIFFGDDLAVIAHFTGGTWHAKVLELATGDTWLAPLQDVPEWAAVADMAGAPVALVKINEVDTLALLPLTEGSALVPTEATYRGPFATMANDEAFYIGGVYENTGYIAFVDPVTGAVTEYDDFTDLDLMGEP